jgi:hypothetical protein
MLSNRILGCPLFEESIFCSVLIYFINKFYKESLNFDDKSYGFFIFGALLYFRLFFNELDKEFFN